MYRKKIRIQYARMTPGFRKIADYILDHRLEAAFLSKADLARRLDVDPTTLDYFARDVGYEDHAELKKAMQKRINDERAETYQRYEEVGCEEDLLCLLHDNTVRNLQAFFSTEASKLASLVRLLKECPRIWLTGEHVSYQRACWLAELLRVSDLRVHAFHPDMVQAATVLDKMQPEELLLAIALKTPSPDAGYVVRLAREKGLHTVTVADCKALCPAREAELVVLVPMESPFGIPNSTVASVVLNMLWEAVAGSPPQEAAETFVNYQIHLARLQRLRRDIAEYDLPS